MAARGRKNPADWPPFEHLEQAIRHLRRAHRSIEIAQSELDPGAETSAHSFRAIGTRRRDALWQDFERVANAIRAVRRDAHRLLESNADFLDNPETGPAGAEHPPPQEPVRDGHWHREDFVSPGSGGGGPKRGTLYTMATAKGRATILPYRPRTFPESVTAAQTYESATLQKPPKGARWLAFVWSEADWKIATGEFWSAREGDGLPKASAHRTLDEAKIAAENALRRLPMPNPAAKLTNEGILAGSTPIPSGLDRPRYQEGILAGSQPIPSGFGWPSTNAGVVDPPVARRTKPRQPK